MNIEETAQRIIDAGDEDFFFIEVESILKDFAAEIWTEAIENQIERECMRQQSDRQDILRKVLLKATINPYKNAKLQTNKKT